MYWSGMLCVCLILVLWTAALKYTRILNRPRRQRARIPVATNMLRLKVSVLTITVLRGLAVNGRSANLDFVHSCCVSLRYNRHSGPCEVLLSSCVSQHGWITFNSDGLLLLVYLSCKFVLPAHSYCVDVWSTDFVSLSATVSLGRSRTVRRLPLPAKGETSQ